MLCAVFGRRGSEERKRVFCDALERFPLDVISRAFSIAEQELERFPTPRVMREICQRIAPSTSWKYFSRPSEDKDPETGKPVTVLIDPDPNCAVCREPKFAHPTKQCTVYHSSGLGDDRVMFSPQHCPEGREFLAELRNIANRAKSGEAANNHLFVAKSTKEQVRGDDAP
jgi:hypothetical protein